MALKPRAIQKLVGEVSEAELAVRLIEAHGACRRPQGESAEATLAALRISMPDVEAAARRQAQAALNYMSECFANALPVQ